MSLVKKITQPVNMKLKAYCQTPGLRAVELGRPTENPRPAGTTE